MSTNNELLAITLKKHKFSATKVRQSVFAALDKKEPQTMREVIAALPHIDRASAYRTIDLFERLGIVQRLQIGWKYKLELTDQFHPHHHHLSCSQCGKIIPIHEHTDLENEIAAIAKSYSFSQSTHQLEIQGLCQACQSD